MRKGFHSGAMLSGLFGLWLMLYSTCGVAIEVPPMPFVTVGDCVGNCNYRQERIASTDTIARTSHQGTAPVAFQIRKGQRFYAIDSVVITTRPGILQVMKTCKVDDTLVRAGDRIYLLYQRGEGRFRAWFKGNLLSISPEADRMPPEHAGCFRDTNDRPAFTWRIKVVSADGRHGWLDSDYLVSPSDNPWLPWLEADWLPILKGQRALEFSYGHDSVLTVDDSGNVSRIRVPAFTQSRLPPDKLLVSGPCPTSDCTNFLIACGKWHDKESCSDVYRVTTTPNEESIKLVSTVWFAPPYVLLLEQETGVIYRIDTRSGESRPLQFPNLYTGAPLNNSTYFQNPPSYFSFIAADKVSLSGDKQKLNVTMTRDCYGCRDELKSSHVVSVNVATWEAREVAKQSSGLLALRSSVPQCRSSEITNLARAALKGKAAGITLGYLCEPYIQTGLGLHAHAGIDLKASEGTLVYAIASGDVVAVDRQNLGKLMIKLSDGKRLIYLHLSRIDVHEGQSVSIGDPLGLSGSKGADSPHLHIEVRTNYSGKFALGGDSCGGECSAAQVAEKTVDPDAVITASKAVSTSPLIGYITNVNAISSFSGCGCGFKLGKDGRPIFQSVLEGRDEVSYITYAVMKIDGREVLLKAKPYVLEADLGKNADAYQGDNIVVRVEKISSSPCKGSECEFTEMEVMMTVTTGAGEKTFRAIGDCGC